MTVPAALRALACAALALVACLAASPAAAGERIHSFASHLALAPDGSFEVLENIVYGFGAARKHGIYRDIPVAYGRGVLPDYQIWLTVLSVTDEQEDEVPYRVSREGDAVRIRIGDPDVTVTGERTYAIRYRVQRGVLWLQEHDEIYWNATGTGWGVPIDRAVATVTTPQERPPVDLLARCYTGPHGSRESACEHAADARTVRFESTRPFVAREGLTVVVGLPKGLLDAPSAFTLWRERAGDWISWPIALPLLVCLGMGAHWWRHGRDPSGAVAIPVRYEPPEDMRPAEMGVVLDQRADLLDITATILDLAVRGVLRIEEIKVDELALIDLEQNDYQIHRLVRGDAGLAPYEQRIVAALFGQKSSVLVSSLRNQFYKSLPGIRTALYEAVSSPPGAWFPRPPDVVRARYVVTAFLITLPLAVLGLVRHNGVFAASMVACGLVASLWGAVMPRRTRDGRRAHQHIRGFREFIERVEVDRLERLGMRKPEQFERLLPYAFVLGVAHQWADAFADLYAQPPGWFHTCHGGHVGTSQLVDRLDLALTTTGSTMTSEPGSGSSGFGGGGGSGGGFGGGGGGSW